MKKLNFLEIENLLNKKITYNNELIRTTKKEEVKISCLTSNLSYVQAFFDLDAIDLKTFNELQKEILKTFNELTKNN